MVSPYVVSGARMASMAVSPAVLEFADMVSVASDLRVEELLVGEGSRLASRGVAQYAGRWLIGDIITVHVPRHLLAEGSDAR